MSTALELTEFDLTVLLMVAVLVAIAATYLRVPYTVALVVVGLFIGFGDILHLELSQSVILLVFLPPLLFDGAVNMDVSELRRRWRQVGVLATAGTLLSAFVIALILSTVTTLDWHFAFLLAVMLSPTDPVSVLAIFKEHGAAHGLRTLLEGESVFNDAVGIVLFTIAVDVAFPVAGHDVTLSSAIFEFGREVFIGAAVGLVSGSVVYRLMATVDDHLIEIMLSVVLAFGSYLVADRLGGSGLIATVSAGLFLGTVSPGVAMSPSSRIALLQVWEVIAFLANSALFLLIGLQFDLSRLRESDTALVAIVAVGAVLGARLLIVYGLLSALGAVSTSDRVSLKWQHALFWGGLRGSIPIALVLGLGARQAAFGGVDPVAVIFAVVFVSLVGQGLTYGPLLRVLGLSGDSDFAAYEEQLARSLAIRAALRQLDALYADGELITARYEQLRAGLSAGEEAAREELGRLAELPDRGRPLREARAVRRIAAAQLASLRDGARRGLIPHDLVERYAARLNAVDSAEDLLAVVEVAPPADDGGANDAGRASPD